MECPRGDTLHTHTPAASRVLLLRQLFDPSGGVLTAGQRLERSEWLGGVSASDRREMARCSMSWMRAGRVRRPRAMPA
jgi:hypothetical protein